MPKSTRPERIFADSIEDAIVIEYFVLDCVESGSGQHFNDTSSQKKEIKIHTGAIRDDADISKMAKKVMRKCTVIPHQWISRVEDILYEIQQRDLEDNINCAKNGDNTSNTNRKGNIDPTLDDILASLYGEADEQISSIKKVLSLCNNEKENNVEAIVEHQQLMSAMTRILGDESSSYSSDLTLHICQVFLSVSEHEELHPTLVAFRVGSLILAVARSEVQKVEALGKDSRSTAVMLTLDTCLSILMRLSNDVSLMRKMIKKDLLAIIHDCLVMDGIPSPTLEVIVHMLHKASGNAFEASVAFFIKTNTGTTKINRCEAIAKLVVIMIGRKKLPSRGCDFDNIVAHSLGSLFNLSFDATCRDVILEAGIGRCLPNLLKRHSDVDTRLMSLGLMYNLTISPEGPRVLYFKEMVRTVVKLSHNCASASECLSDRLGAVLVNLTCSHIWAEALIPHVGEYLLQIKTKKDVMLAKVVKNIASWTRSLQVCIGIAHTANDVNCLLQITSNPSKYYIAHNRHSGDELGVLQEAYAQYQKHQFWHDCINPLLNMVSTLNTAGQIKLEIIGTLSNLTRFDVGPSETWDSLISEYSLVKVMSEIMSPVDMAESKGSQEELLLSMKVAVVVFCNQLCYCSTAAAKLVANTNLIHELVNLWGEYEYAPNDHLEMVHFHILSLCETLLQYEETRSIVLFGTEAMQFIFDSLETENLDLNFVARRCLDLLADYNGTSNALQDGIEESFASLGKERRFMIHNKKWLKEITNMTNT